MELKDLKFDTDRDGLNCHWNCKNPENANVIYLDRPTSWKVLDWMEHGEGGDFYMHSDANMALSREELIDRAVEFIQNIHGYKPAGWGAYRDLMCDFINTFLKKDWGSPNVAELPELVGRLGVPAFYKKKSGFTNRPGPVLELEYDCDCDPDCGCEPQHIFL